MTEPERMTMAGNGDMNAHISSYDRMIAMLKWGAVACFVVVAIVIWLIAA